MNMKSSYNLGQPHSLIDRPTPLTMYKEVHRHIKEMVKIGAVPPLSSPWASAVILVTKKDVKIMLLYQLEKIKQYDCQRCLQFAKNPRDLGMSKGFCLVHFIRFEILVLASSCVRG